MDHFKRESLVKRRDAFLERIANTPKPTDEDRRELQSIRNEVQLLIKESVSPDKPLS